MSTTTPEPGAAPFAHRVEATAKLYLTYQAGRWQLDPVTDDGAPLDAADWMTGDPDAWRSMTAECSCTHPGDHAAAVAAALATPMPTWADLTTPHRTIDRN